MNINNKKPAFKITALVLAILLTVTVAYSVLSYINFSKNEELLNKEKQLMISNLTKSKDSLDVVINENSSIKSELMVEQQKISNLIDEVNQSKISLVELEKFKKEVKSLKIQIGILKKDKLELVQKYESLKMKQDSTAYVLQTAVEKNEKLMEVASDMNKIIKKSSKVSLVSLKTQTLKQGRSGSIITDKASKVNILKISFTVLGNKLTSACEKDYYVQIIDGNNNVIGDKLSKKFGSMVLDYSYASKFKYENENLEVSSDLELENLPKGNYIVSVFDKDKLALKTSFVLR
ncbi:hypothetical protein [Flavobacterium sp.]|uniref:hypothetical protein n=1 Tax=Flavobacterium sp. TaxID=239 RepID=UPI00286A42ED|nr:hypothetical protein [Flavobacterium sp.]